MEESAEENNFVENKGDDLASITKMIKVIAMTVGFCFIFASFFSVVMMKLLFPTVTLDVKKSTEMTILPAERSTINKINYDLIIGRNIFNIEGKTGDDVENDLKNKDQKKNQVPTQNIIKSDLPYKLVGLIYGGDPYSGLAVINDTGKNIVSSYMVGDHLTTDATIIEIQEDRVILLRSGQKEFIELEQKELLARRRNKQAAKAKEFEKPVGFANQPPPEDYKEEGFERKAGEIQMSSDFKNKLLTVDFAKVLQDAKAEPNYKGKDIDGFKLTRIREDSIYQKAGLQNDDIIKEINGIPLQNAGQAIKLLNSLRGENEVELRIERDGKNTTINMQVRP